MSKRPSPAIEDDRLQLALKVLRQEKSLTAAAREAKISPERLRRYATEKDIIERRGRRWIVRRKLPRRMLLFSEGGRSRSWSAISKPRPRSDVSCPR